MSTGERGEENRRRTAPSARIPGRFGFAHGAVPDCGVGAIRRSLSAGPEATVPWVTAAPSDFPHTSFPIRSTSSFCLSGYAARPPARRFPTSTFFHEALAHRSSVAHRSVRWCALSLDASWLCLLRRLRQLLARSRLSDTASGPDHPRLVRSGSFADSFRSGPDCRREAWSAESGQQNAGSGLAEPGPAESGPAESGPDGVAGVDGRRGDRRTGAYPGTGAYPDTGAYPESRARTKRPPRLPLVGCRRPAFDRRQADQLYPTLLPHLTGNGTDACSGRRSRKTPGTGR